MAASLSNHVLLLLCMGVLLHIGGMHLWFWRRGRGEPAHLWVAAWCGSALLYQAARLSQLYNLEPEFAVQCSRMLLAIVPFLVHSAIGFGRSLSGRSRSPRLHLQLLALSVAVAGLALGTDWFVSGNTGLVTDWFGHTFMGAPLAPPAGLIGLYLLFAFVYVARAIQKAPDLGAAEKGVLLGSISGYILMGVSSLLTAVRLIPIPTLAEYGPLLIALGFNYLLVHRHRRLTTELRLLVEESEHRFRRIFEDAPLGVIACDTRGQIVAVNPHMLGLLGSPSVEFTQGFNLLHFPPLVEAGVSELFQRCLDTGEPVSGDATYTSLHGNCTAYHLHVAPLRGSLGNVTGAQALVEDVGEKRGLEEKLRESKKLEAVGRLAAGIAHEINNPMAYVRSNLSLLHEDWERLRKELDSQGGGSSELVAECAELIEESCEGVDRTIAIVREFKEFARPHENRSSAEVATIVDAALRTAAPQVQLGVRVESSIPDLPPLVCCAERIVQVVVNLVVNAAHAIEGEGLIEVRARLEGDDMVLEIEDDGPGIPEDLRAKVFEPFFTTKPAGEGTGLGLYICYEIIRRHGGQLRLESELGSGTRCQVRLPRAGHTAD